MHVIDREDELLLDLWQRCRGGNVTGQIGGMAAGIILSDPIGGHLPEAGGVLDQANCTMESLAIIEAAYQALRPRPGRKDDN
jgi:hypothetical protein